MATPTRIDIPHTLGKAEAIRRLRARSGDIASHIPGGLARVQTDWPAEDHMTLDVSAIGQSVTAAIDVREDVLHVAFTLPFLLAPLAEKIEQMVRHRGVKLLLADDA